MSETESNESEQKRVKIPNKTFADLPPRVIVHEILSRYALVSIDSENDNIPFLHFGFFTRDRLRNIWFMFSSSCSYFGANIDFRVILDFQRLVTLKIVLFGGDSGVEENSLVKRLANWSTSMRSLEVLHIVAPFCTTPSPNLNLFSKEGCFPNLRTIFMHTLGFLSNDLIVCPKTNIFRRIKNLYLCHYGSAIVHQNNIKNVLSELGKYLEVLHLNFPSMSLPLELKLPNLRDITLNRTFENLSIVPSLEKVKSLDFNPDSAQNMQNVSRNFEYLYKRCMRIKNLSVSPLNVSILNSFEGGAMNPWLLNPKWNPLKHMRKIRLAYLEGFTGTPDSTFGEEIEFLEVRSCPDLLEDLFTKKEYKKLTRFRLVHTLRCENEEDRPTKPWKILQNVEDFKLEQVYGGFVVPFLTHFFKLNESSLSNVRRMKIEQIPEFCDEMIENIALKELRELKLVGYQEFKGTGLKKENLEHLERVEVRGYMGGRSFVFDCDTVRERLKNVEVISHMKYRVSIEL